MKNLLSIILASILFTTAAMAQHGPKHKNSRSIEEKAEHRLGYLEIVLDLTDQQMSEIRSLQTIHIADLTTIKDKYQPIIDQMRDELKTIREKSEGETFGYSREEAKLVREKYQPELDPMKHQIETERKEFDNVLLSILDQAQAEKYRKLQTFKESARLQQQEKRDERKK